MVIPSRESSMNKRYGGGKDTLREHRILNQQSRGEAANIKGTRG